jgi:hypothetical protein
LSIALAPFLAISQIALGLLYFPARRLSRAFHENVQKIVKYVEHCSPHAHYMIRKSYQFVNAMRKFFLNQRYQRYPPQRYTAKLPPSYRQATAKPVGGAPRAGDSAARIDRAAPVGKRPPSLKNMRHGRFMAARLRSAALCCALLRSAALCYAHGAAALA